MKKRQGNDSGLVYSTEQGRLCPSCGKVSRHCLCKAKTPPTQSDGIIRVSLDKKGRKGKGVTLITGLALADSDLKQLAKKLKQRCGSGGTVKDGVIEIQGDHRQTLLAELARLGRQAKQAGG